LTNTKQALEKIKAAEAAASDKGLTPASAKKLRMLFDELSNSEPGPLSYVDVTTAEEMKEIYGVDAEEEFEMMDEKEVQLKGANNPNKYAWLTEDIELVVLGNTARNRKVAKEIVQLIVKKLESSSSR